MNRSEIKLLQDRMERLKAQEERIMKVKKSQRTSYQEQDLETIHNSIRNIKTWLKDGR